MPDSLRIVHAVRSDGFAGVERHVAVLAREQRRRGHWVAVIGGDPAQLRTALAGADVLTAPAATVLAVAQQLGRFRDSDILHVHMTAAEAAGVLAGGAWPVPMVATRHFAAPRGESVLGHLAAPLIRRRLAAQIAISRYVAEHIDGPSVVALTGVESVDAVPPAAVRERTVLLAQRLEPEKGASTAVHGFARSGLAAQGWRLLVAGDGVLRRALQDEVSVLGLGGSVDFLGQRRDVPALMLTAGLLIAPCPAEGLGLTALEAMASGLPVVAAGGGGHLETVGLAEDAALFEPGNADSLASQLRRAASDEGWRAAYATELRSIQRERFTVEAHADAVEAVYRSVL